MASLGGVDLGEEILTETGNKPLGDCTLEDLDHHITMLKGEIMQQELEIEALV